MVVTREDAAVVEGLWELTAEHAARAGLWPPPPALRRHLTAAGAWNGDMYYTNFEARRCSLSLSLSLSFILSLSFSLSFSLSLSLFLCFSPLFLPASLPLFLLSTSFGLSPSF